MALEVVSGPSQFHPTEAALSQKSKSRSLALLTCFRGLLPSGGSHGEERP